MKNILVTGGAGFIGSALIRHLIQHTEHEVLNLDKLTYAGNLSTLKDVMDKPNFRFVKLDICDREGVYKLFEEESVDSLMSYIPQGVRAI